MPIELTACGVEEADVTREKMGPKHLRLGGVLVAISLPFLSTMILYRRTRVHPIQGEAVHKGKSKNLFGENKEVPVILPVPEHETWGVITTINDEVDQAVTNFVSRDNVGLVVVGDLKTDHRVWEHFESLHRNVVYLSPAQELPFELTKKLPWNHFGRKNIGFLFAIHLGAERIYDFDDDNHLLESFNFDDPLFGMTGHTVETSHHLWNPYPFYEPTGDIVTTPAYTWPRGFPLQFIKDENTTNVAVTPDASRGAVDMENLAVVQFLADHDPDVDAIYRMAETLPITFKRNDAVVVSPRGSFTPWNAQAVLISETGFFGMLLPVTVTGRVSDIWRSYITTRLLWETDMRIAFTPALVTQYRNPHSYQEDLESEKDLYYKVDELLITLASWTSHQFETLDAAYLDLVSLLVQRGFFEQLDLDLAKAWVKDLNLLGYKWPPISNRLRPFVPRTRPIVDGRKDYSGKSLQETELSEGISTAEAVGRKIVWIGQGPAKHASKWIRRFSSLPSAALFYHSYDERCEGCIYAEGTTFATGRNMLLRKALETIEDVAYFVMFDHDLVMSCDDNGNEDECWRSFHIMLADSNTSHPLIVPKIWWDPSGEVTNYQGCVDNAIWAMRHDFVNMFYPLSSFNTEKGWNLNTHVNWHTTERCYPNAFLSDSRWRVVNPDHTDYPTDYKDYSPVVGILEHDYAELGPWDPNQELRHRCSVSKTPPAPTSLWPKCTQVFNTRFDEWRAQSGDGREKE